MLLACGDCRLSKKLLQGPRQACLEGMLAHQLCGSYLRMNEMENFIIIEITAVAHQALVGAGI